MKSVHLIIKKLGLIKHIEGGYFFETFRSELLLNVDLTRTKKSRNCVASIYFFLRKKDFSAFHKLSCDELWNYHSGSPVLIITIDNRGKLLQHKLGKNIKRNEKPQVLVKSGLWFAAVPVNRNYYSLVSCITVPAFDYEDFHLAKRSELIQRFPQHKDVIQKFTRE
ncbi:MAG: cupin domain-containing protein [Ignavibacteria bacterium]